MSDKEMTKAKELVEEIVSHQKHAVDRMAQFDKQIEQLQTAQRKIAESQDQSIKRPVGDDTILSRYRDPNGDLILKTKSVKQKIEGRGVVSFEQEGLIDAVEPANDWHGELLKMVEDRTLARMVMTEPSTPRFDKKLYRHLMKAPTTILPSIKKAFNDSAGDGAALIPDQFISDLWEPFAQRGNLRSLLRTQEVDRSTILIPRLDRGSRPYLKGKVVSNDPALYQASDIATAQKTINIGGLATRLICDDAAMEDAAFAMTGLLRSVLGQDIEDAYEDCMINGDTSGAQDTLSSWNIRDRWGTTPPLGTSSDHRLLFNGWRKQSFDKSTEEDCGAAAMTFDKVISALGKMGEYGVSDKVMIVSPEVMTGCIFKMTQVQTLDVFGDRAVVLRGQIASLMGMPVIMSRWMSADLAASGKYTGAGATSGALIVSRDSYYEYLRRGITVETQKDINSGSINIVATLRSVMDSPDPAGKKNVTFLFNSTY